MEVLIAFLVAALVAAVVYFVATLVKPLKGYAEVIGIVAFLVTLLVQLGAL